MKNNYSYTKRKKGIALIMVITIMGFMGVVMLLLSSASNIMSFQTDKSFVRAYERNLISSGRSWAKTNIKNRTITDFNDTIQLDVNDLNIQDSSLELIITNPNEVQIRTSCGKGKQHNINNTTFDIEDF